MGDRANYAIIENGQLDLRYSHWGALEIAGDAFWGPDWTVPGIRRLEPTDEWLDETDAEGAILVDLDRKRLRLFTDHDLPDEPMVRDLYLEMLRVTWPGWDVAWAERGILDIASAAGADPGPLATLSDEERRQLTSDEPAEVTGRQEAAARLVPMLLSDAHFDPAALFRAIEAHGFGQRQPLGCGWALVLVALGGSLGYGLGGTWGWAVAGTLLGTWLGAVLIRRRLRNRPRLVFKASGADTPHPQHLPPLEERRRILEDVLHRLGLPDVETLLAYEPAETLEDEDDDEDDAGEEALDWLAQRLREVQKRSRYYKMDSTKLTLAEYWRLSPSVGTFLLLAFLKMRGIRIDLAKGMPYPVELIPLEADQLPGHVAAALDAPIKAWQAQGMRPVYYYTTAPLGQQEAFAAALLSDGGTTVASVMYARTVNDQGYEEERVVNSCVSKLPDGRILGTSGAKKELNGPFDAGAVRLPGASIDQIFARHRERLAGMAEPPVRLREEDVPAFLAEINNREMQYYIDRGLYVPMTEEETGISGQFDPSVGED